MKQYRKKPVVVEAFQWQGGEVPGVVFGPEAVVTSTGFADKSFIITIHHQHAYLSPGDWVIKEHDGVHYYPCKDDIFRATYEEVTAVLLAGEYLPQGCPVVLRGGKVYSAIPQEAI